KVPRLCASTTRPGEVGATGGVARSAGTRAFCHRGRAWMTAEMTGAARIDAAVLDRRRPTSGASRTSRTPHGGTAAHEQPTQPAVRGPGTTRSAPAAVGAVGGLRVGIGAPCGSPGAPAG